MTFANAPGFRKRRQGMTQLGRSAFQRAVAAIASVAACVPTMAVGHAAPAAAATISSIPQDMHLAGRLAPDAHISFAFTLPLRDPAGLTDFLKRVQDPADSLYHKFLTPRQFADRFGPSAADYATLQTAAAAGGLTVTHTYASRMVLDVEGTAAATDALFGVRMSSYVDASGRLYYAPSPDPSSDAPPAQRGALAALDAGVVGLDDLPAYHTNFQRNAASPRLTANPTGLSPAQIRSGYNIPAVFGNGQTIALVELDGYSSGDIATFESTFSLASPPLTNISVDRALNVPGAKAEQVTLDIDMVVSVAPNAAAIDIYQGPNSFLGQLDCLTQIANDNIASVVSTSWGLPETQMVSAGVLAEGQVFQQMAAQGQSTFAAAGNLGSYDDPNNPNSLTVQDPASQPYVTAVGGTSLTLDSGNAWSSEVVWNDSVNVTPVNAGGGGGFSQFWPAPSYQQSANLGSPLRQVPDVSLNADPVTGYSVYFTPSAPNPSGWDDIAGTGAASALWAGFTALVDQQLSAQNITRIGLLNPMVYADAVNPATYAASFHDITAGNNFWYPATTGYDVASGWGSMNGAPLLNTLVQTSHSGPGAGTLPIFAKGTQMIAAPYDYTGTPLASIFNQPVTLYRWDPTTLKYIVSPSAPCDTVHQMDAYWVNFPANTAVQIVGTDLTLGNKSYSINLSTGWNMVGNPYATDIPMAKVTISDPTNTTHMSLAAADAAGYAYAVLYSYDATTKAYMSHTNDVLTPNTGYWVKALQPCIITVTNAGS